MSTNEPRLFTGYFPLWGATFDSDSVGIVGGRTVAYVPDPSEWNLVQKSDVWFERWLNSGDPTGPKPPLCLVTILDVGDDEEVVEATEQRRPVAQAEARTAVLTLRLWKAGWFLDPALAEEIFRCELLNQRLVGPYRQAMLGGDLGGTPAPYELSITELSASHDEVTPVARLRERLDHYRLSCAHASADIVIDNFNRSYGYQIAPTARAAFLFTALDAMLGGFSARRVEGVRLRSRFRARVTGAVRRMTDYESEAAWLDEEGRAIRNAIAHGHPASVSERAGAAYERLQAIVRAVLRQYIDFSVAWSVDADPMRERLELQPDASPMASYNALLEARARGEASAALLDEIDAT
jgi:hypothetical protein